MTPEGFMKILAEAGIHYTAVVMPEITIVRVEHREARRPKSTVGPEGSVVEFLFKPTPNGPVFRGLEIKP